MDSCKLEGGRVRHLFGMRREIPPKLIRVMREFIPLVNSDTFSFPNLYRPFFPIGCKSEEELSSALPVSCGFLFVWREGGVSAVVFRLFLCFVPGHPQPAFNWRGGNTAGLFALLPVL